MKKSRFTTDQIIRFIKQAEAGMVVAELARQHGFGPASSSFYTWRAKYGGMEGEDAKRLKELEADEGVGREHSQTLGVNEPNKYYLKGDAALIGQPQGHTPDAATFAGAEVAA